MSCRLLGLVVWLAACSGASDTGSDASSLAREEPRRTKVKFINEEPPYDLCLGWTRPGPRDIAPPATDAGAPVIDAPTEDAPPPDPAKPCKCVYWTGADWKSSPPDRTAIACEIEVEEVREDYCEASGPPTTMEAKRCAPSETTCDAPTTVEVLPDNRADGAHMCQRQPADACEDVTYTGTAREARECTFCKLAVSVSPANPEPDTDYYRWLVQCITTEWADEVVTKTVTQRCETYERTSVYAREPRDGWSVTNLCESCTTLPCGDFTCQVIHEDAAAGCAATLYTGKCVPTGTDPATLPAPADPRYTPRPPNAPPPDASVPDAGVPDAGAPASFDGGILGDAPYHD